MSWCWSLCWLRQCNEGCRTTHPGRRRPSLQWQRTSTVTEDIRIGTHDVHAGLLLWVGTEINDGSLGNVLNVILLPVLQIRFDRMRSSFCRLRWNWPAGQTECSTKVNILDIWTLLGLYAWPAYSVLLWLLSVWDLVEKPEARTLSDSKMLGEADLALAQSRKCLAGSPVWWLRLFRLEMALTPPGYACSMQLNMKAILILPSSICD